MHIKINKKKYLELKEIFSKKAELYAEPLNLSPKVFLSDSDIPDSHECKSDTHFNQVKYDNILSILHLAEKPYGDLIPEDMVYCLIIKKEKWLFFHYFSYWYDRHFCGKCIGKTFPENRNKTFTNAVSGVSLIYTTNVLGGKSK